MQRKISPIDTGTFESIRKLVLSRDCLTTIDHDNLGENKIFVTCDASKRCTGAVLTFGRTGENARPVAYPLTQIKGAQLNYPVHEQEMLSIILALKQWRVDLMGTKIEIYTDHRTLENFNEQKDLSRRQLRWMEYLSQYEYEIHYVNGEDNTVADALSWLEGDNPPDLEPPSPISAIFSIALDPELIKSIKAGYKDNLKYRCHGS